MKTFTQHKVAAIISVFLVIPAWMLLDRTPPYEITAGRVMPEMPVKNGSISIEWDVKPLRSCNPQTGAYVTRTIVDSRGIPHIYTAVPAIYGTNNQFTTDAIHRDILLPENLTGHASYSSVACYPCNPIQAVTHTPICINTPKIEFEIVDDGGAAAIGPQGEMGIQGDVGPRGETGLQGAAGAAGPRGLSQ
jgi:hypothetical protein